MHQNSFQPHCSSVAWCKLNNLGSSGAGNEYHISNASKAKLIWWPTSSQSNPAPAGDTAHFDKATAPLFPNFTPSWQGKRILLEYWDHWLGCATIHVHHVCNLPIRPWCRWILYWSWPHLGHSSIEILFYFCKVLPYIQEHEHHQKHQDTFQNKEIILGCCWWLVCGSIMLLGHVDRGGGWWFGGTHERLSHCYVGICLGFVDWMCHYRKHTWGWKAVHSFETILRWVSDPNFLIFQTEEWTPHFPIVT